ncbi:MAG: chromosome segregation protein SMC [Lachnospiraceae bacterium]|nr:chromosome segregation protein SMC [Lachnospiraceae bacterium]
MYLKSIEIQGFKSFATKTILEFHDGITGIVGPNGSGKSNIADAVRWVLGEQKVSQLRSSGMQDVIFAGTESRRPVSFAYVAITLDNSDRSLGLDYSEVTVARRVYRSGESEYLLNGTQCRLKDIHELFYDTGIGQEGYSIIGQGQIDRILSGKPEERRELFDEAAGIVKFKRRKQVTLKKLENEQQNMLRITDVMGELERQVGPLARQAEQARTYLKKREELKSYEVNLFLHEMDRVEKDGASVAEKYGIADAQMAATKAEFEETLKKYEDLDREIQRNDADITRLQNQISESEVEREKGEGRINVLKEQINALRQSETHVNERIEALEIEIARCQKSKEQYETEKEATDTQIEETKEDWQDLNDALKLQQQSAADLEGRIERGKSEILTLLDERAAMEGEQQRCSTMVEQANIRRSQLNQQLLEQKSTEKDVSGRLSKQEASLNELNQKVQEMETKRDDIDKKRQKWREQTEELTSGIDEIRQQYLLQSSQLESLKNIAERYDGYGNGIRRVMERKEDVAGIHGVVADLISVDKRYETAIETALGGHIQNVVTDDEKTAKEMIAYLKENRCGRVTFLPLTSVQPPENVPTGKVLTEKGVIGLADTLVKTEKAYENVAAHLLGRVLVVDNVDNALAIAKKHHYSLRIVTLEGELLTPGGAISGGAFKNNSNLLGRSREIEALEQSTAELAAREKDLRERLEDVQTADELLADDQEEIRTSLQDLKIRQNTLQVEVEHLKEESGQQEAFFSGIQKEMEELESQKQELAVDSEQIQIRLTHSREREADILASNEECEKELEEVQAGAKSLQEDVSDVALTLASLQQKSDFYRENIDRVEAEIQNFKGTQNEVLVNAAGSGKEIDLREQEIREITEAGEAAGKERDALTGKLRACVEKKEQMTTDHKEFFDKREEMSQEISRLDREMFRLNDQKEKLERVRETQTDYMWQEYELTYHEAEKLRMEDLPGVTELRKRISGVRSEIRELGDVNVNAIEEYRSVSERYEFLKGQYEDLEQAEKNLQDIIADLDEGMKKQFSEKFADIQKEFDRTFQELFGGGRGTLELTMDEDQDILDCGIGIIAQPPGKKLQNMMQLSGGEKALTAIALLFAIQNLKPSPFCLLDEIEAALDDSNVVRFARYLTKLSHNTQFIVITHRRGTMNVADRLYGVTMQEKGVTALVSVDLIEKELD